MATVNEGQIRVPDGAVVMTLTAAPEPPTHRLDVRPKGPTFVHDQVISIRLGQDVDAAMAAAMRDGLRDAGYDVALYEIRMTEQAL
jgi:hypothetical protein